MFISLILLGFQTLLTPFLEYLVINYNLMFIRQHFIAFWTTNR